MNLLNSSFLLAQRNDYDKSFSYFYLNNHFGLIYYMYHHLSYNPVHCPLSLSDSSMVLGKWVSFTPSITKAIKGW